MTWDDAVEANESAKKFQQWVELDIGTTPVNIQWVEEDEATVYAQAQEFMTTNYATQFAHYLADTEPVSNGKCVFVSGPMRGIAEFNFPAFDAAADRLSALGYCVHSPAHRDRAEGFDPTGLTGNEDLKALGFDLGEALVDDADMVRCADEIYMLKGWLKSAGAQWELSLAQMLGKKVTYEQ